MITFGGGGRISGSIVMVAAKLAEQAETAKRLKQPFVGMMAIWGSNPSAVFLTGKDAEKYRDDRQKLDDTYLSINGYLGYQGLLLTGESVTSPISNEPLENIKV